MDLKCLMCAPVCMSKLFEDVEASCVSYDPHDSVIIHSRVLLLHDSKPGYIINTDNAGTPQFATSYHLSVYKLHSVMV